MANSRIYVQDTIVDRFISLFNEKFSQVNMGDPLQEETNHGPLADEIQHRTVSQYILSGKESGNIILGERPARLTRATSSGLRSSPIHPRMRRS